MLRSDERPTRGMKPSALRQVANGLGIVRAMPTARYSALRVEQTESSTPLIFFAAPATEIEAWSGIVQRQRVGRDETIGFQREESPKRVAELIDFYGHDRNVIQNPLLCAARDLSRCVFEPSVDDPQTGTIAIEWESLAERPLLDLLRDLQTMLEARLPDAAGREPSEEVVGRLKQGASDVHGLVDDEEDELTDEEELDADPGEDGEGAADEVLFTEETHLYDFWEEVAGRVRVLEQIGASFAGDAFLGFTREAVEAYIRPVVVVDGQHRLLGAIETAVQRLNGPEGQEESEKRILAGENPASVEAALLAKYARRLPVSLLLNDSPEEHVFQFVVVNQKATPIGRALLGTIVSTSLTNQELSEVSNRLTQAGIPLESARAIAYLTRKPDSPFYNLVQRGLTDDEKDLLPWSVLGSLVAIFQHLKGGQLFGQKVDYADLWRRRSLLASGLVGGATNLDDAFAEWSKTDGPWRDVFLRFWSEVRNSLAVTDDDEAGNYWGRPRVSNLFNKISLTILAADFFQFLTDRGYTLQSVDDVAVYVVEWLDGVKLTYFARDWKLDGVKKDSVGTRNQWADLWVDYRKDPKSVPPVKSFRVLGGA